MARSLCIWCGASKREPYSKCKNCRRQPRGEDELTRSVYLSSARYAVASAGERERPVDLAEAAERLQRGEPVDYPPAELERIRAELDALYSWATVARGLFQVFRPALLFLFVGAIAVVLLRTWLLGSPW